MKKFASLFIICLLLASPACAEDTFITLLTGGVSGTYYRVGQAMAKAVSGASNLHVTVRSSAGSAENITLVSEGGAEIAFAQNDITHWAMTGRSVFASGARTNIRAVAALYPEHVQIVTRNDAAANSPNSPKISRFDDLRGRRVGVGAVGSGVEGDARAITRVMGLSYSNMNVSFTDFADTARRLRDGTLDAGIIVAGIPTPAVTELADSTAIGLADFSRNELEALVAAHPYFEMSVIPAGTYGDTPQTHVPAVRAMLITRDDVPEDVIYAFTKALFENIGIVRDSHAVGGAILLENAATRLTAPLHPGAERFYREAGILKEY